MRRRINRDAKCYKKSWLVFVAFLNIIIDNEIWQKMKLIGSLRACETLKLMKVMMRKNHEQVKYNDMERRLV